MSAETRSEQQPIIIHHIEGRRSMRVAWLCEELGLPYKLLFTQGDVVGSMFAIRKAFPQMPMSPVVTFDGQTMVESGAILEVLHARYGGNRFAPTPDSPDYPAHMQWLHFAEATLLARIGTTRFISLATGIPVNALPSGYQSGVDKLDAQKMLGTEQMFAYMQEFLSSHSYFSGSGFGLADIMMQFGVRGTKLAVGTDPMDYPAVKRWLLDIESRPAYPRALKACCPSGVHPDTVYPSNQPLMFKPVRPLTEFQKFKYGLLFKVASVFKETPKVNRPVAKAS